MELLPLSSDSFKPFGEVITTSGHATERRVINEGFTERFHDLAKLDLDRADGRPSLNIFRSTPKNLPLQIVMMERHPLSTQAFYPLSSKPYIVVVASPGEFKLRNLKAFLALGNQGVNYSCGTWHHYSLALEEESDFLVIDRIADDENCEELRLDTLYPKQQLPVISERNIENALMRIGL